LQVYEVFYYAQKAVLYPTAPLFYQEAAVDIVVDTRCFEADKFFYVTMTGKKQSDVELNDFQKYACPFLHGA
jgi:Ras family protein T1